MPTLRHLVLVLTLGLLAACKQESSPFCPQGLSPVRARSVEGKSLWCESTKGERAQWIEWHPGQSKMRQSCSYRAGKPEGSFTAWHVSGKPWVQGQFAGGHKVGKWKQWDDAGNEVAEGEYNVGRLVAGAPVAGISLCEKMAGR